MSNHADNSDGPLCLAEKRTSTGVWVCIRPKHRSEGSHSPTVEQYRRRHGEDVRADKHVFIKRGNRAGQTGPFFAARNKTLSLVSDD